MNPFWLILLGWITLALSGCGCIEVTGQVYDCTCSRRCQGTSASWSTSPCATDTSGGVSTAEESCSKSCSPEAACTCTCSETIQQCVDKRGGCH